MTNTDYTHLAIIADRSGSMAGIGDDMNGGLKTFLEEQEKQPGKLLVDVVTFDSQIENPATDALVASVEFPIIKPRGSTALLDAVGMTVVRLGEKVAALDEDERPSKVIVLVVTDGYENASREYTGDQVKELVKKQQDEFSWEFVFLGANIDSFAVGGSYGFRKGATMDYLPTAAGVSSALRSAGEYVIATRSGVAASFTDEDRSQAVSN